MAIGIDHGAHRAAYMYQLGEQEDDLIQLLVMVQIATGNDQIADAGAAQIEAFRHGVDEKAQLMADQGAHRFRDRHGQRMTSGRQLAQRGM